jgi:hypothetical protein
MEAKNNIPLANTPVKAADMRRNIARRAEKYGLIPRLPAPYPNTDLPLANQVALPGMREGWGRADMTETYRLWFAHVARHLQPDPDGPDMPWQERALLPDDAALVPSDGDRTKGGEKINGHGTFSCPPGPPFFGLADAFNISRKGPHVPAQGGEQSSADTKARLHLGPIETAVLSANKSIKDWRRVATRYDRRPKVFLSAAALAATAVFWLCRKNES